MAHARPFWTFTLQDLSNDIKNASLQGVLTPAITLWVFGSLGGLPSPIFGSVSGDLTLPSKWGYDNALATWDEPSLEERERAMGFQTSTIGHTKVTKLECNALLGRGMDLNSLTWLLVTYVLF